ncbi:cell division protein PerM [Yinghuangia seranimata]|uniref:cell division protein PerM n=1 Tax=Yinghuangia seranimata TaxID=408067 RepID=UPI00248C59EA|nr:DUF6350 family protein [Yinghuangia seranimata]MDI2126780.1 DUF6350 family protein [Yinghuangia seranimata]
MSDTPVPAPPSHPGADRGAGLHTDVEDAVLATDLHPDDGPDDDPDGGFDADAGPLGEHAADLRATLDGALAGLTAVGLGMGIAVAPVLVAVLADAFAGGFTDPGAILRTAGQIWLAAQRVGLDVAGDQPGAAPVRLGIVPLGVTVPLVVVLIRAGRRCAAAASPDTAGPDGHPVRAAALALAACTGVYAACAYGLAVICGTDAIQPVRERAPLAAGAAALVLATYGAARAGAFEALPDRMPRQVADRLRPFALPAGTAVRAGAAAAATLAAGGAVVVSAALVTHLDRVTALADQVAERAPDTIGLALLCAALMPNAIACAVAYASCAGFAVGVGTTVAPTGVKLGALPALPLLGALPGGPTPAGWCTLAVPLAAGLTAGLLASRTGQAGRLWTATATAAAAGPVAGALTATATWLSTGAAGTHRLTRVGPHVLTTAAAITAEVTTVAALTALIAAWYRWRTVKSAAALETVVVAVPEQPTPTP